MVTSYCALVLKVLDSSSLEDTLGCWIVSDWNIHCWSKGNVSEWITVHSKLTGLNRATYIFPAERTEGVFVANMFILAFVIKITQGASGGYNCYSVLTQMTMHPSLLRPCILTLIWILRPVCTLLRNHYLDGKFQSAALLGNLKPYCMQGS